MAGKKDGSFRDSTSNRTDAKGSTFSHFFQKLEWLGGGATRPPGNKNKQIETLFSIWQTHANSLFQLSRVCVWFELWTIQENFIEHFPLSSAAFVTAVPLGRKRGLSSAFTGDSDYVGQTNGGLDRPDNLDCHVNKDQ